MIPDKAIKKIKNQAHIEIAVGSLIAYGVFPLTDEGIAQAKKIVEGRDTWLAPSDLNDYYDGIDTDLMIGKQTPGIRSIRNQLKEFYGISNPDLDVPKVQEKVKKKLKRTGKKISVKRKSDRRYVISPRNPKKDLENLADDIIAELLDEKAYEQEILEDQLSDEVFRVKLPADVKLPPTMGYLHGNRARWEPEFESDLDAAIYFAGKSPLPKGPKQAVVVEWLKDTLGIPWIEISNHRDKILEKILETINLPGVEEEYPYVYIDTVDPAFESKYAEPEEDEDEFLEDQISDEFVDEIEEDDLDDLLDSIRDEEDEEVEEEPEDDLDKRMEDAFNNRLDDLLESIKEDPEQTKQKPKKTPKAKKPRAKKPTKPKVQKTKKPRTFAYDLPSRRADNFNAYLSNKISDAFKLAAVARKNAKLAGAPQQKGGFFLKKALLNEFGGDFLRRTKGTFSKDPTEAEDPALSRGKRFAATLSNYLKPADEVVKPSASTNAVQLSLFDDSPAVVSVNDQSVKKVVSDKVNNLSKSFVNLNNVLDSFINKKATVSTTKVEKNDKLLDLLNKFEEVKKAILSSNKLEKQIVAIKSKQLVLQRDVINDAVAAQKEAKLESGEDLSSTFDYSFGDEKFEDKRDNFIFGDGQDEGPSDGFDIDFDFDRKRRRRPGTRRRYGRRKWNNFRKEGGKFLDKTKNWFGKNLGRFGRLLGGAGNTGGRILGGLGRGLGGVAKFLGGRVLGPILGDMIFPEAVGSSEPTMGPDGIFRNPDGSAVPSPITPQKKLAEGGVVNRGTRVMVGEAGPEAIVPLSKSGVPDILSSMAPTNPAMHSVSVLLGVTKQVISSVGPAAAPIKPSLQNIIAPLEKLYGAPAYALTTDIGDGLGDVSSVKTKLSGGGLGGIFEAIKKFLNLQQTDDDKDNKPSGTTDGGGGGAPMGQGTDFWTLAAVAALEDGRAQGVADVAQSVYNRLADGAYGSSVYDILTRDGQYQVAFTDPKASTGPGTKVAPIWKSITDADSAAAAIQYYYEKRGQPISIQQAKQKAENAAKALQNPTLQKEAAAFVQGRTDFTASASGSDVVQRPGGGNAFYWAYGTGKMRGKPAASIPSMGATQSPTATQPQQTPQTPKSQNAGTAASVKNNEQQNKPQKLSSVFDTKNLGSDKKNQLASISPQSSSTPQVMRSVVDEEQSVIAFVNTGVGSPPASLQAQNNLPSNESYEKAQKSIGYSDIMKLRLAIT